MTSLTLKLAAAQTNAMSIRSKTGGFPFLAEALRQSGILFNRWSLPSCQSVYLMDGGAVVQQGNPLITGMHEIPPFNQEALIKALRSDQAGNSTFPEFF